MGRVAKLSFLGTMMALVQLNLFVAGAIMATVFYGQTLCALANMAPFPEPTPNTVAELKGWSRSTMYSVSGQGELFGVIVGVSNYRSPLIPDLPCCADGARMINDQMSALWGERAHLKLLVDRDAKLEKIEEAMTWLASEEDSNSTVLLYFTGHGNEECLAPYDTLGLLSTPYLSVPMVDKWLDTLDSKRVLAIFDSCGSGAFADALAQDSRVIITSGTGDESTPGDEDLSWDFVRAFHQPSAVDTNNDSQISAQELYAYIHDQHVGHQHTPHLVDGAAVDLILAAK